MAKLTLSPILFENMLYPVLGKHNSLLKEIKRLDSSAARENFGRFLAEGLRVVAELASSSLTVEYLLVSTEAQGPTLELAEHFAQSGSSVYYVEEKVLDSISPAKTSQGLLAVVVLPKYSLESVLSASRLVVLPNLQDPGNVGALIRSALAFNVEGVLLLSGADPYNSRAVRASAGAVFYMPLYRLESGYDQLISLLRDRQFSLVTAEAHGGQLLNETEIPQPWALILGAEVQGVADPLQQSANYKITIPLAPSSESLNVAAAGAVIMYELARRRI